MGFHSVAIISPTAGTGAGNNISPLLSIARSCAMLVTLTATPLFTGHRDLLSIGHLLNFKDLCSGAVMDKNKVFSSSIQKAHAAHHKALGDMEDQTSTTETNELRNLVNAQLEPVSWLKGCFKSHLIRHTGESRDFQGEPLIGLCAHKRLVIKITLSPNKMGLIKQAHKDCKGEGRRDGALFDPWAFYSGPWQENMSPGLDKNCQSFNLQETFKEKGGTKLKALVTLISFFVQYGNEADPILDSKGTLCNDTSLLASNGSSVNDINSESATSGDSVHVRDKTLNHFSSKQDCRGNPCHVLIISGVGTMGLNITTANVVIFTDQLWSPQDERQVIGCVQQKGQTKKVTVVWLLADGTTDTLLYQFSQGKARQSVTKMGPEAPIFSETCVSKAKAFLALNNDEDSDGDTSDSGIDNRSPSIVQVKGKGTSHKRKRSNDVADKGKKQKTKGGFKGKEVAAPPSAFPNPLPSSSKGEVPLPLDAGRSSPINDGSLDLSGDVPPRFPSSSSATDFNHIFGNTDATMSTSVTGLSPISSAPSSPGLFASTLPSSGSSSNQAEGSRPSSNPYHRWKLEMVPSDSDEDGEELNPKPYISLTQPNRPRRR
ncbi:P-loop containing nucleoside triphosphate hydrolase protein [Cantharellus anzutake]|uniref:P-loop containing nucleoside triphosphate hydrolase protein n=1 Tax=Cantharellus anzutake TaxID=1750568 RepID=UPI001908BAE4|nr:P-loop containing nucleoside triphosphate hydrolase protein [Cantharellus anzutake]KAF8344099.1 P-loop containing nucleoside triphosphate hydrolase protein [Cantharellus anzutake]